MQEKVLELLSSRRFSELKVLLSEENPADIVAYLENIPQNELILVFRILPKELAAETFVEMDSDMQMLLISAFSDKELRDVLSELFVDDAVDIIEEYAHLFPHKLQYFVSASTSSPRPFVEYDPCF